MPILIIMPTDSVNSPTTDSIVILHMTLPNARHHQGRRLDHLSRILPGILNIQPEILERTRDLVSRILAKALYLHEEHHVEEHAWHELNCPLRLRLRCYLSSKRRVLSPDFDNGSLKNDFIWAGLLSGSSLQECLGEFGDRLNHFQA